MREARAAIYWGTVKDRLRTAFWQAWICQAKNLHFLPWKIVVTLIKREHQQANLFYIIDNPTGRDKIILNWKISVAIEYCFFLVLLWSDKSSCARRTYYLFIILDMLTLSLSVFLYMYTYITWLAQDIEEKSAINGTSCNCSRSKSPT